MLATSLPGKLSKPDNAPIKTILGFSARRSAGNKYLTKYIGAKRLTAITFSISLSEHRSKEYSLVKAFVSHVPPIYKIASNGEFSIASATILIPVRLLRSALIHLPIDGERETVINSLVRELRYSATAVPTPPLAPTTKTLLKSFIKTRYA